MTCLWVDSRLTDQSPNYFEPLESRWCMSSVAPDPIVVPLSTAEPMAAPTAQFAHAMGYSPQQIRAAYGFDRIVFTTPDGQQIQGDGTGQTIAIVTAFHHPNIYQDFTTFNATFGLPDTDGQGNFALVQRTFGSNPDTDPLWALEASLDVQWAHAMAPGARILLVEAASNRLTDMFFAVNWARQQRGVVAVSMSWGTDEFVGQNSFDPLLQTPARQGRSRETPGVTFVAASGDLGAPAGYPATSPNVLAVGGTALTADLSGDLLNETGWSGSGGGRSIIYTQTPDRQQGLNPNWQARLTPDVAFNAAPSTGFPAFCSFGNAPGESGWFRVGGTSAGAPPWAALVAIANQGRRLLGLSSLDGATQTLPALYDMDSSNFNDITAGHNGYAASTGFDLVTGLGSPVADRLAREFMGVPDRNLTSTNAITGALTRPAATSNLTSAPQTSGVVSVGGADDLRQEDSSRPELQARKSPAIVPLLHPPTSLNPQASSEFVLGANSRESAAPDPSAVAWRLVSIIDDDVPGLRESKRVSWNFERSRGDQNWWTSVLNPTQVHLTVLPAA